MTEEKTNVQKAKEIVALLPKENCGKCGFDNCGRFALAVIEEAASPFGCHHNPGAGYEICKVLGKEVPADVKVPVGSPECHHGGRHHGLGHHGGGFGHGSGHHGGDHGHEHSGGHHHGHGL